MTRQYNITQKFRQYIWLIVGCGAISLYLYDWFMYPGIFHTEVAIDLPNFFKRGMNGANNLLATIFDLNTIEGGYYRPRILAFLIQYYDIKWWDMLNKHLPWGGHWPMVVPATILFVFGAQYWIKCIDKTISLQKAFGLGGLLLFLPHYIAGSFLFLRTAKLFVVGISFILIGLFFHNEEDEICKSDLPSALARGFGISLLCTIDEQILGVVVMLASILGIRLIKKRSVNNGYFISLASATIFYFVFYFTWGRWLCQYYTPGLRPEHPHDLSHLLRFGSYIVPGMQMFVRALSRVTFNSTMVLGAFAILWVAMLVIARDTRVIFTSVFLMMAGLLFSIALVTAHPIIASLTEQSSGFYYNVTVIWAISAFVYPLSAVFCSGKGKYIWVAMCIIPVINCVYIQTNLSRYEFTHATQGGVFLEGTELINECLEKDEVKMMGVNKHYFDGLVYSEEEYLLYLQSNSINK